eukprot:CAMPEP_0170156488 /NCGR_PEP_ID=MMETSP0033_2-20121228/63303_1 /TAXON_ID=195969 /ORGANISM="Dolichomastix tenuilepis, Strain CCMP3274" /LENGTH=363 /DNA_ID=CAMNT_0010393843 /DNA_START=24 /DNA_END=1112 /DNA_ORIENTATION=-
MAASAPSAAAAVHEATSIPELLFASHLLVAPGEESASGAHLTQHIHQEKRQVVAARALAKLARWSDGEQEMAVDEEGNLLRLCQCAAAPSAAQEDTLEDAKRAVESLRSLAVLRPRTTGAEDPLRKELALLWERAAAHARKLPPESVTGADWASQRLGLDVAVFKGAAAMVPFRVLPGLIELSGADDGITLEGLIREVPFKAELVQTRGGGAAVERRETCWMVDPDDRIEGLAYSGKIMKPTPFTPLVAKLRDAVEAKTNERFDCALLNLYVGGHSACAFHSDPDHGRLWAHESVIISFGAARRFQFRLIDSGDEEELHSFVVSQGDGVFMGFACQDEYQHAVLASPTDTEDSLRVSVVFKRA